MNKLRTIYTRSSSGVPFFKCAVTANEERVLKTYTNVKYNVHDPFVLSPTTVAVKTRRCEIVTITAQSYYKRCFFLLLSFFLASHSAARYDLPRRETAEATESQFFREHICHVGFGRACSFPTRQCTFVRSLRLALSSHLRAHVKRLSGSHRSSAQRFTCIVRYGKRNDSVSFEFIHNNVRGTLIVSERVVRCCPA
jgi:hypothetical protein